MLERMTTFFQAWRRREANQQAADWAEERETAHRAVEDVPPEIRGEIRRVIELLLEGPDDQVEPALDQLSRLLEPHPELRDRFFRLRIVDDAVEFLK
jgi:hypothetical protein